MTARGRREPAGWVGNDLTWYVMSIYVWPIKPAYNPETKRHPPQIPGLGRKESTHDGAEECGGGPGAKANTRGATRALTRKVVFLLGQHVEALVFPLSPY